MFRTENEMEEQKIMSRLTFNVEDKPKFGQLIIFAIQQMLAVLAATIAVPMIVQNGLTPAAAMFGAGVGTLVYQLFTRRKSPVFLSSSFAFINSMFAAFQAAFPCISAGSVSSLVLASQVLSILSSLQLLSL